MHTDQYEDRKHFFGKKYEITFTYFVITKITYASLRI